FDRLKRKTRFAGEIEMRRPSIFGGSVAAHQQHDELDQAFVELGTDTKAVGQPIGGFGNNGGMNPHPEQAAQLSARACGPDVIVKLLLAWAQFVSFKWLNTGHVALRMD